MIVALAGGVGGSKLADGLYRRLAPDALSVIVNTGDDFQLYGLHISPDADTVLYTLAGLANPETGWGIAGDTFETLQALGRYGEETWFQLGDRDFSTHILRTKRLAAGWTLTRVLASFTDSLQVRARILPMSDNPIATVIRTAAGELAFQDYFVRRQHADDVVGVAYAGIESATLSDEVREVIGSAEAVILCPSNPIVSIGPILAVPGMRDLLRTAPAPIIAVSPLVQGQALRGPADRMLAGLGRVPSSAAIAELYSDFLDGIVIDRQDTAESERIAALRVRVLTTDIIMRETRDRERLAGEVLEFARRCSAAAGQDKPAGRELG
jgi:LPPG:FO 2-phospho-L-lactate transferase